MDEERPAIFLYRRATGLKTKEQVSLKIHLKGIPVKLHLAENIFAWRVSGSIDELG